MRATSTITLCLVTAAVLQGTGRAAELRPFSEIAGGTVHLADLFDDLGATPDRVLGHAPAPGERIVVEAPQLAAIARDFGVAWRPGTGAERAVVERRGDVLPASLVTSVLREGLRAAGAPDHADIATPAFEPVLLPVGTRAEPVLSQLSYDPAGGRFTALISVARAELPVAQIRLSGQAIPMDDVALPTHALAAHSIVRAEDVQPGRVRASLLHGRNALSAADAIGMEARHELAPGQPLTAADLMRRVLVPRGATVRMTLDSGGLSLAAQGVAMEQGALGERIHIQNPVSHALVEALVVGEDEVRVAPRGAAITLAAAP